ncbi:GNAT family N-acetyltransferase [Aminipila butyrica]|uniref:GNAT family N-acetyltransferase n=1 Tax=Aminipila butyrica TaxID=433296 RepID=A0A858BW98_9FIRM|nr:GNAT family N-acetyltransferase [Aminipila butyrica]QIB69692.1 GNAT family N-acetyltransferase [Aminipila butyrica]
MKKGEHDSKEIPFLEKGRLIFRKLVPEHVDELKALMGNLAVMYAWEHPFSDEQVENWTQKQLSFYAQDGVGYFAAYEKSSGNFIGQAGLHRFELDNLNGFEVCYMLLPQYWHKGYATESVAIFSEYACHKLSLNVLYAQIKSNNQPSIAVAEKSGFRRQGVFSKYYNGKDMEHFLYMKELGGI